MSQALVSRRLDLTVEGLEQVPRSGPAIIAARHYHHVYDGAVLLATIPRPVRIVVAADWAAPGPRRSALEAACRAAGWPVVMRAGDHAPERPASGGGDRGTLLRAVRQSVHLLRAGGVLLVFPEGYPTIDPGYTPKTDTSDFLPFEAGFARIAHLASRESGKHVPIIPAGFSYLAGDRWQVTLRFGAPLDVAAFPDRAALIRATEE
nr:1-acyl-sn-glycerol-3-phosphate acyltransferase [Chloroflexia bacterium]